MIQIDLERNTTSSQGAAGSAVTWFDYKQQQCPIIECGMYMVVVPAYSYQIIDINGITCAFLFEL